MRRRICMEYRNPIQMEEQIANIPNAEKYFRWGSFLTFKDKTIRTKQASILFERWEQWVTEALEALQALHQSGFVHGAIEPSALQIGNDNRLRIGRIMHMRRADDPLPIERFDPHDHIDPPEVLLHNARHEVIPFSNILHALQTYNYSFDQIPSLFPNLSYDAEVLETIYDIDVINAKKIDVWMLGNTLMTVYLEMLAMPEVFSTPFYRTEHERFMNLLERMLHANPTSRISIDDALILWNRSTIKKSFTAENDEIEESLSSSSSVVESLLPSSTVPSTSTVVPYRRLVLNERRDPSARNKTRRNPRN